MDKVETSEMTLREQLWKAGVCKDHVGNYCSDLHVLNSGENEKILMSFLSDDQKKNTTVEVANVEGHAWYRREFFDVPFSYTEYYHHD